MPTDVIKTIGSAGGRDYATPALWIAACPANLVTDDKRWIGECYNDSQFIASGSPVLDVAGITTDSTRYVICRCATGQSFSDHADVRTRALLYNATNGVAFQSTQTYGRGVRILVDYTQLLGIQTTGKSYGITFEASNCVIKDMIAYSYLGNYAVYQIGNTSDNSKLINCLLYTTSASLSLSLIRDAVHILGCTLVSTVANSGKPFETYAYYGAAIVKNTAIFGFASISSHVDASSGYNATDLSSAPGSNNQVNLTYSSQFQNSASDYRAVSGGSLDLNGTPDTTNLPVDISGTTRHATTPTIGCWEVMASGINADAGQGLLDLTAIAPTVTKSAGAGIGLVKCTSVAPTSAKAADAGIGAIDFTGIVTTAAKSAAAGSGQLSVVSGSPAAAHAAAAGVGLVELVGVAPASSKLAAAGLGLVEFVGLEATGGIVSIPKFPMEATFVRAPTWGRLRRAGS